MSIFVEILIKTDMETLWRYTQSPEVHERWDLRFSNIRYLPRPDESKPQIFEYSTKIRFGMTIRGTEPHSTMAVFGVRMKIV